jgi:hypothetical protein
MGMKKLCIPIWLALLGIAGCAGSSDELPPTTHPSATAVPADHATAAYWYNEPAVASVTSPDFKKLWDACALTLRDDQFEIDREDYRLGFLTTWPMISKQAFEFWRSDTGSVDEMMLSTLQTVRRTVRIEVARAPDGSFIARPKVLVEQFSHPERRLSNPSQYGEAFTPLAEPPMRVTEEGATIPNRYWYALGRDEAMERELARSVREKIEN